MLGRLVTFACVVDPGELVDRANHVFHATDVGELDALNDVAEREAEVAITAREKIECMGVAIEGAPLDLVNALDADEAVPVDELLLDGVALGVMADGAAALVVRERRGEGNRL